MVASTSSTNVARRTGTSSRRRALRGSSISDVGEAEVRFAPAVLSFLPFVWGDYWIIGLASDYSWAVVGSPDREYLWTLTRSRIIAPAHLAAARANGFDTDRLVMKRHTSTDAT
jgi:apolipoprotein D and lipocalin family protein